MPVSQNGFSANDKSMIASYTVPGTTLRIPLRKGDVSVVLLEFLRRYHLEVESLYNNPQDLWGYAERKIRGSATTLSNHASGTAADHRAVRHPLGVRGTFNAAQVRALDNLLRWFEGVLRHGKDYSGRVDEMHVEINKGIAEVTRIANKIRGGRVGAPAPPPAPSTPRQTTEDRVMQAPVEIANGAFRAVARCEQGATSSLFSRAWITLTSTWGPATNVKITSLGADGRVLGQWRGNVANNATVVVDPPPGVAAVTWEGSCTANALLAPCVLYAPK